MKFGACGCQYEYLIRGQLKRTNKGLVEHVNYFLLDSPPGLAAVFFCLLLGGGANHLRTLPLNACMHAQLHHFGSALAFEHDYRVLRMYVSRKHASMSSKEVIKATVFYFV
jgi:hypothetical protein